MGGSDLIGVSTSAAAPRASSRLSCRGIGASRPIEIKTAAAARDKTHVWHMDELAKICRHDLQLLLATPYKMVDVTYTSCQGDGAAWWSDLTSRGGEGMVVKPLDFIFKAERGWLNPPSNAVGPNICESSTGRTTPANTISAS
jgi:hypothetical protein